MRKEVPEAVRVCQRAKQSVCSMTGLRVSNPPQDAVRKEAPEAVRVCQRANNLFAV